MPDDSRWKLVFLKLIDLLHRPLVRSGSDDPYHRVFREFAERAGQLSAPDVLEIGSRDVTGVTRRDLVAGAGSFVGFDVRAGPGVDVVGDAHRLSEHFERERFDLVFGVSVLEHLAFPWKVVVEIHRVLKPGGLLFLATHPTWPEHETPADFWRFPPGALRALLHAGTGFEIVRLEDGLPCRAYSLVGDPPTRRLWRHPLMQGVAVIARKSGPISEESLRWDIDPARVIDAKYPAVS